MYTYIEVFDVLADDLYRYPADVDMIPLYFSIQPDSPPVQKVRQGQGLPC